MRMARGRVESGILAKAERGRTVNVHLHPNPSVTSRIACFIPAIRQS